MKKVTTIILKDADYLFAVCLFICCLLFCLRAILSALNELDKYCVTEHLHDVPLSLDSALTPGS